MNVQHDRACMEIDPQTLASVFDREPFGFKHNLNTLAVFELSRLEHLASLYTERDYFVASGAREAATPFYAVRHSDCNPAEALARLTLGNQRILLKRPENYDVQFRDLLQSLFAELTQMLGGIDGKIVRLDSSILISSSKTITPFHFDPEISFFFQIAGDKSYHIYSPRALAESELEQFYVKGIVNIAQVPLAGRDSALEHVFSLQPGSGMHQPRNAPHWVETSGSIAVSYAFSFETDKTRALGRTRAFNHYGRALHWPSSQPGRRPAFDALKAGAMNVAIPARKTVSTAIRSIVRR